MPGADKDYDDDLSLAKSPNVKMSWRDVPVTMEFLAELFDAYCGASGHNLVVQIAASKAGQKL